ncbi:bifunctional riboflavin kinase/FAD synthetase, partial [Limosilactobacillus fermentum]
MEVIKVHHPLLEQQVPDGPVVVAMGFFDGVHRGHQAVIARAKEEAVRRQVPLAVLTYEKLPGIVYQRYEEGVHYLTTIDRKLALLEQLGADLVYLVDFTAKLGSLSPEEFVSDYLVRMHAVAVVAGFDHTYGKKDVATMDRLAGYAAGRFDVVTVKKQETRGAKIGSSRIRDLIDQGRVEDANQLLGYRYQTSGIVVHGLARGRTIGFPTANVAWNPLER